MTEPVVHNMRDLPNYHSLPPPWDALHEVVLVRIWALFLLHHNEPSPNHLHIHDIKGQGPMFGPLSQKGHSPNC